jgi:hypothetical protein
MLERYDVQRDQEGKLFITGQAVGPVDEGALEDVRHFTTAEHMESDPEFREAPDLWRTGDHYHRLVRDLALAEMSEARKALEDVRLSLSHKGGSELFAAYADRDPACRAAVEALGLVTKALELIKPFDWSARATS